MKSTKQPIEGQHTGPVIDPDILVMQVVHVVIGAQRDLLAQNQPVKSVMSDYVSEHKVYQQIQAMQRMRWNDPKQRDSGEVYEVLDRVHRQA